MKKSMAMAAACLLVLLVSGCNTVRGIVGVGKAATDAVGAVKDDVFGAVNTLVNSAEAVKTNVVNAAKATTDAATK